jgi:hypothetical protein
MDISRHFTINSEKAHGCCDSELSQYLLNDCMTVSLKKRQKNYKMRLELFDLVRLEDQRITDQW